MSWDCSFSDGNPELKRRPPFPAPYSDTTGFSNIADNISA